MERACKECSNKFIPNKSFHRLCTKCARIKAGVCPDCGLAKGGYFDNYFIYKCSCWEYKELNDPEHYDEYW